jgi:hypothetical protein
MLFIVIIIIIIIIIIITNLHYYKCIWKQRVYDRKVVMMVVYDAIIDFFFIIHRL